MIIKSIAPSRISLFGGGTDIDEYAKQYGGIVLSFAVDIYSTTTLYTGNDLFSKTENIFPYKSDPKFYYKILDEYQLNGMHHAKHENVFDGLIESGLGSSASAVVAMLGAMNRAFDLKIEDIPSQAYKIEKKTHFTGKQDHYASFYGGINCIEFKENVNVIPLAHDFLDWVMPHMVLVHTNISREWDASEPNLTKEKIKQLDETKKLALASIEIIGNHELIRLGELLDYSWEMKKKGASTKEIDTIYEWALKNGALGGKLLGSGGGGYMLFLVNDKKAFSQKAIENKLSPVDFNISWNGLMVKEI